MSDPNTGSAWSLWAIILAGSGATLMGWLLMPMAWTPALTIWSGLLGGAIWTDGRTRHVPHSVIVGLAAFGVWRHWQQSTPWPWVLLPIGLTIGAWLMHTRTASVLGGADGRWIAALACALSPWLWAWTLAGTCVLSLGWIGARRIGRPDSTTGMPLIALSASVLVLSWVLLHR